MSDNNKKILVTGGTGKTGGQIVKRLVELGFDVRVASRSGTTNTAGAEAVKFDWADNSNHAEVLSGVGAVYMIAPLLETDPFEVMKAFVEQAMALGAVRFVLLSASSIPEGGPAMGLIHKLLREIAPEWAVLRPSWFMQNFSLTNHLPTIRDEGAIYSACEDGKIPFVDADDIAEVAVKALTDPEPYNTDHIITGPKAISYDTAAAIISEAIGKPVKHIRLTSDELTERWMAFGLTREYSAMLAGMDVAIAGGSEDYTSKAVEHLTGSPALSFEAFVQKNVDAWQ